MVSNSDGVIASSESSFSGQSPSMAKALPCETQRISDLVFNAEQVALESTDTNKTTGDVGIALEDATGNFLAATGLAAGTLQRGKDLLYTLNTGDSQLSSHLNIITEDTSGGGLSRTHHR